MNKRLNLRIALILLMLTLVVIVPVYAQDVSQESTANPEPTVTAEATEVATVEVTLAAVAPTVEVTSAATVEATTEATVEATEASTVEVGGVLPTEVPPESRPVAGVPEEPTETLSSSGVVILVLLVGLAAMGGVAFSALMRGRKFTSPTS
jgi:hypothetical protein